jgi:5-(carboxyamino)imidazole ribonucleotide synthase
MGHLTLTGATLENVRAAASQAALLLGLPAVTAADVA